MSDGHQNAVETQRRRSPELDLNQAFTREEEEEDQEDPKGPHWLQVRQQEPWLQSREQDQASQQQKQKAMEASPSSLPKEQHQHQHQTVAENPNSHGGEKQSQQAMGENLNSLQEDQQQQQQGENLISGPMAKQNSHVMETWNFSDSMEVLRRKPSLLEDRKQNPERPALPSSPGTMWEHQRVVFPHGRKSLSPVSPPEQRKSLSPVSPDRRFSEEQLETALPRGRSSERRTSPYRSPHRKHSPRGDSFSRWRHERDLSMSPRDFFKRHRERSLSTSPAGRSNRVGRSRSRSPPLRGYHHSPRPSFLTKWNGRFGPPVASAYSTSMLRILARFGNAATGVCLRPWDQCYDHNNHQWYNSSTYYEEPCSRNTPNPQRMPIALPIFPQQQISTALANIAGEYEEGKNTTGNDMLSTLNQIAF